MTSAWVLWMLSLTFSSTDVVQERWKPFQSYLSLAACQAGLKAEDRLWSKLSSSLLAEDTKYWVCLPAPIDPRPSCSVEK